MPEAHVRADQRYAWRGPSLLVVTTRGVCDHSDPLSGYYFREARHLRTLRLTVNGETPWLCADTVVRQDELAFVYVYPELTSFGGGGTDVSDDTTWHDEHGVPQRAIDLRLRLRTGAARLEVVLTAANRSLGTLELTFAWEVDADFADIGETLGGERQQQATVTCEPDGGGLRLRYLHGDLPLSTHVGGGTVWTAGDRRLETRVRLRPQQVVELALAVQPCDDTRAADDEANLEDRARDADRWRAGLAGIATPGSDVGNLVNGALDDLASLATLTGQPDECLALQAGIPLYPALFGRDTITAGWQAAMFDGGAIIDHSLTRLGRLQSAKVYDWNDEEPGRIPYQIRAGPLARLRFNPYAAYYADFASPLLFVIGLAHAFAWSGDTDQLRRHWDAARRILDWARGYGDRDGDGYLEYLTRSEKGTKNQGWKDSGNAIMYEDGRPVPSPVGTCDLQGYWYAAQQLMAVMAFALGEMDHGRALWTSARELKQRFSRDWWMEDEGFYALALDADKRLARSVTSNVGQCIATGIIDDAHLPRVVGRLFAPDMFSGWGVRTLSTRHPAYNPLGYHLGTVWPVENATIALGLRRFGFDQRALDLCASYFDLARLYERGRIPECVGGYARAEFSQPGAYPRANPLQTWNQSGFAMLVQTMLGLQPVAPLHTLFVDPVLPEWMPEVLLRDIRLGGARATVRFRRDRGGKSFAEIEQKHGSFHLVHQPPPESLEAGVKDRFGALITTFLHH